MKTSYLRENVLYDCKCLNRQVAHGKKKDDSSEHFHDLQQKKRERKEWVISMIDQL